MLRHLTINNLAIIDSLSFQFKNGFSALTGESGAGKSILIDAIQLIIGIRADSTLIRSNESCCLVKAIFDISQNIQAKNWLESQQINNDYCEIERQIQSNGNSKATINKVFVNQKSLSEFGSFLVTIHSQHAHHALLTKEAQRELVDAFGGLTPSVNQCNKLYQQIKRLQDEKDEIEKITHNQDALAFLQYQIEELTEFKPLEEEFEKLNNAHRQLAGAEDFNQDIQYILALLNEENPNIYDNLQKCISVLKKYHENEAIKGSLEWLIEVQNNIDETLGELKSLVNSESEDNSDYAEIDKRLTQWHELARKHRIQANDLYSHFQTLLNRLNNLENTEQHLEEIESQLIELKQRWWDEAKQLSIQREKSAYSLAKKVNENLKSLSLNSAIIQIFIDSINEFDEVAEDLDITQLKITSNGQDNITFLFTANQDVPPKPMSKIASGGELSRVALAIAIVSAKNATNHTLIFDEVDVGISGATTEVVANNLKELSQSQQVLSITHQAQVAAKANQHLLVEKQEENQRTITRLSELQEMQRVSEMARMIGGVIISDTIIKHAQELLMNQ